MSRLQASIINTLNGIDEQQNEQQMNSKYNTYIRNIKKYIIYIIIVYIFNIS